MRTTSLERQRACILPPALCPGGHNKPSRGCCSGPPTLACCLAVATTFWATGIRPTLLRGGAAVFLKKPTLPGPGTRPARSLNSASKASKGKACLSPSLLGEHHLRGLLTLSGALRLLFPFARRGQNWKEKNICPHSGRALPSSRLPDAQQRTGGERSNGQSVAAANAQPSQTEPSRAQPSVHRAESTGWSPSLRGGGGALPSGAAEGRQAGGRANGKVGAALRRPPARALRAQPSLEAGSPFTHT